MYAAGVLTLPGLALLWYVVAGIYVFLKDFLFGHVVEWLPGRKYRFLELSHERDAVAITLPFYRSRAALVAVRPIKRFKRRYRNT